MSTRKIALHYEKCYQEACRNHEAVRSERRWAKMNEGIQPNSLNGSWLQSCNPILCRREKFASHDSIAEMTHRRSDAPRYSKKLRAVPGMTSYLFYRIPIAGRNQSVRSDVLRFPQFGLLHNHHQGNQAHYNSASSRLRRHTPSPWPDSESCRKSVRRIFARHPLRSSLYARASA